MIQGTWWNWAHRIAGAITLSLGILVIIGWYTHNELLIQIDPSFVPMQYNTALGFVASAIALLCVRSAKTAGFMSVFLIVLGSLTLTEYIAGVDLHIDQLLMDHYVDINTSHPGRMAPNTALCFLLFGIGCFIVSRTHNYPWKLSNSAIVASLVFSLGFIAFTGYLIGIDTAYGWGKLTKMAVHTSFGFVILGLGLLAYTVNALSPESKKPLPTWLPWPVGIGCMSLSIAAWQALKSHEYKMVELLGSSANSFADEGVLFFGIIATLGLTLAIRTSLSANKPEDKKLKDFAPLVALFFGFALSALLYTILDKTAFETTKARFEAAAQSHASAITRGITAYTESLYDIEKLFNSSRHISREEFASYVQRNLKIQPGLLGLQWLPRVSGDQRTVFEQHISELYQTPLTIRLFDGQNYIEIGNKKEHYPILYTAPYEPNQGAIGIDVTSHPHSQPAVYKAIDSRAPTAISPLNLVQLKDRKDAVGAAILLAVYHKGETLGHVADRRSAILGIAAATIEVGTMIEDILDNYSKPGGIHMRFVDITNPTDPQRLYTHASRYPGATAPPDVFDLSLENMHAENIIAFGDRQWQMIAIPAHPSLYPTWDPTSLVLPMAVILLTILLFVYLRHSIRQEQKQSQLIDEVKKSRQKLTETQERFELSVRGSGDALWEYDSRSGENWFSSRFTEILGYLPGELPNTLDTWRDHVHPDELEMANTAFLAHLSDDVPYDIEYRMRTKSGAYRWFRARAKSLRNASGEAYRTSGSVTDITTRKEMENRLARAKEAADLKNKALEELTRDYKAILNFSSDFLFIKDAQHRFKAHNLNFGHLIGVDSVFGAKGKTDFDVFPAEDAKAYYENERKVIEQGEPLIDHLESYLRPDGSTGWVKSNKRPIYDDQQNIVGLFGFSAEVTELIAAKKVAEEATQAKSDFLANMSHEIRTPMNAIIGMSHMALGTDLAPKQRNYIEKVHRSAESLLGIINDILDFSKIEAGKLELEYIDFQLEDVMESLNNLLGLKAEESGVELMFDLPCDLPTALIGDPLRLGQILLNLGSNAIKFTEPGGEVVIQAQVKERAKDEAVLQFSIRDNGIGMNSTEQQRLFESFSQVDSSTTRKHGGTGLGLAISKQLVSLMQGDIWVESEAGQGSTFSFTTCLGLQENTQQPSLKQSKDLDDLNILIVDDNSSSRLILRNMLETFGFAIDEATNGTDAIAMIEAADKSNPYGLVLMDWRMPGIDGIETARQIQNDPKLQSAPTVIMVTAYGREEAQLEAKDVNLAGFLSKPVMPSTLLDTMLQALGHGVVADSRSSTKQESIKDAIRRLNGAEILLVEDNEINQELAVELLRSHGLTPTVANNGQEALDLLNERQFDGVLMDCQMPVMDGYTATRAIRAQQRFRDLPIIAMTANVMAGDREKVLQAGMNDHIAKPININQMFQIMAHWITPSNRSQQSDQQSSQQAPEIELPPLTDIDISTGLQVSMNNKVLYRKLLNKFYHNYQDFEPSFKAALAEPDLTTATRHAHTLKSVAGSIGAKGVQEAAKELEAALIDGLAPEYVERRLQQVMLKLAPVLTSLAQLQAEPSALSEQQRQQLLELQDHLQRYDAAAMSLLEQLIPALATTLPELKQIAEQAENFEFDEALSTLAPLLKRLAISD
ncbi:response regulator [Neiella sp. HB171785]|uniref:Sensory/regulatory protein RpfC n=1 Tax=Neiella litorisoli TaxID=2771431 RepID=A0A8J6R1X7_9GAMM|nr:response regulator [Neiella litorisoli]MBD1388330.1 response regulator [Neiella litorisoli]